MTNWQVARKALGAPSMGVGPFIGFDKSRELFVLFQMTPNPEEIDTGTSLTALFDNIRRRLEANAPPKGVRS